MHSYYNIHTHHAPLDDMGILAIGNLHTDFEMMEMGLLYSIGLHPWYLRRWAADMELLSRYAQQPNVVAIGECGLDRACATPWDLQVDLFAKQIALANECNKPLIIHCVRAFDELLQVFAKHPARVPVIIHGFNKNRETAMKLLERGFYLSFGAAIMNDSWPAAAVLAEVPEGRFLLETDDSAVSIAAIYERAAAIRNMHMEDLILQIRDNFKNVFRYND